MLMAMEIEKMKRNFIVEHTSVSGILYVTIDTKLFCLKKFDEHIKLEVIFDTAPSQIADDEHADICVLKKELLLENDTQDESNIKVSFQNNDKTSISDTDRLDFEFQSSSNYDSDNVQSNSNIVPVSGNESESNEYRRVTRKRKAQLSKSNTKRKSRPDTDVDYERKVDVSTLAENRLKLRLRSTTSSRRGSIGIGQESVTKSKSKTVKKVKKKEQTQTKIKKEGAGSKPEKNFSCPHCLKDFKSEKEFRDHIRTKREKHICKDCGLVSYFWSHHIVHQKFSHNIEAPVSSEDASDFKKADGSFKLCSRITRTDSKDKVTSFYKCDFCKVEIEALASIKRHMMMHTKEYLYQCCVCGNEYRHKGQLDNHFQEHSCCQDKILPGPSSTKKSDIALNYEWEESKQNISILNNDDNFNAMEDEDSDIKTIIKKGLEGKSKVSCSYCKTSFKTSREYTSHHRVSTEGYSCDVCGKVLNFKAQYLVHMKSAHNIELPISSESKGAVRLYSTELDSSGHKNFRCDLCLSLVNSLDSLNRHMLKHTNELKYKCCLCGIQFLFFGRFKAHLKSHNSDKTPSLNQTKKKSINPSCSYCSKNFDSEYDFNTHHGVQTMTYHCEICTEALKSKAHLIVHNNIIHRAEVSSSLLDNLGQNDDADVVGQMMCTIEASNNLNEQIYKCNLCNFVIGNLSILNTHMMKHTNESAFKCCVCGIEDYDSSSFASHMNMHKEEQLSFESDPNRKGELEMFSDVYCQYCMTTFKSNLEFRKHYYHDETMHRNYCCEKCPKNCKYKAHLLAHYNIVHKCEAPFTFNDASNDNQVNGVLCTLETTKAGRHKYKCVICDMSFATLLGLSGHMFNHTGENTYKCCVCDYKHRVVSTFKRHLSKHSRSNHFQCKQCEVYFKDRGELSKHKASHMLQCGLCGEQYHNRASLNYHIKISHTNDDRLLKCDQCGKMYTSYKTFHEHKRNHRFRKRVQCPVCGIFVSRLNRHMIYHSDNPEQFSCDLCPMKFKKQDSLNRHKLVHTKVRNFSCPQCHKKFPTGSSLSRHLKVHLGDKPFVCEICGKACKVPGNLRVHMRVHNKKPKVLHCRLCGAGFLRQKELQDHMDSEHKSNIHSHSTIPTNIPEQHFQYFEGSGGNYHQVYFQQGI